MVVAFWGVAGRVPNLSALLKGPAQRPGTGPPRGVLAFLERVFVRIRPRPSFLRGQRQGEGSPNTHRTNAGGQQDGRGRGPPGSSTPAQASCTEEITIGTPPPSAHRSTAQGVLTGGAAATGHGAPRATTESRPGVVVDRPKISTSWPRRGERPRPGRGGMSLKS